MIIRGQVIASQNYTITIGIITENKLPTAQFKFSPAYPERGDQITFNARTSYDPDGEITSYLWDFNGDGEMDETGITPSYTFDTPGTHTVMLKVTDDKGAIDTTYKNIEVEDIPPVSSAQTQESTWAKVYKNSEFDAATSIIKTYDGNYLIAGFTNSYLKKYVPRRMYSSNLAILKIDPYGNIIWSKKYGKENRHQSPHLPYEIEIVSTKDGGYAVFCNQLLIKLDKDGNVLWVKKYGSNIRDTSLKFTSIQELDDSGFITCGRTYSPDDYNTAVMRLNKFGKIIWVKSCLGYISKYARIRKLNDGGFILGNAISGLHYPNIHGHVTQLTKLDVNGNVEWEKLYAPNDGAYSCNLGFYAFCLTKDEEIVTTIPNVGGKGCLILKLSPDGDFIWSKLIATRVSSVPKIRDIRSFENGDLILIGEANSDINPGGGGEGSNSNIFTLKMDQNGNILWLKTFGKSPKFPPGGLHSQDDAFSVEVSDEGEILCVGTSNSFCSLPYFGRNYPYSFIAVKMSPDGEVSKLGRFLRDIDPDDKDIKRHMSITSPSTLDVKNFKPESKDISNFNAYDITGFGSVDANFTELTVEEISSERLLLKPLYPGSNTKVSKVMQGGVIYRYYTLEYQSRVPPIREPIKGAKLIYYSPFTYKRIEITSDDNGEVALKILTSSDENQVGTYNIRCKIDNIEINSIQYKLAEEPSFPVEILPLTYSTNWVAGMGCLAKGQVEVYITAQQAGGMLISRTLNDPLHTNQDSLGINNNFSTELGVGVEACIAEGHLGPVTADVGKASAGVSVGTFNEFTSLFNTPDNSGKVEKLKEIFFLLVGVANTLPMGGSQPLIKIIDLLSVEIMKPTEIKEILQGVNLSIDTSASLTEFVLKPGKLFKLKANLGSINVNCNYSAALVNYLASGEIGVKMGLTWNGKISLAEVIGYNICSYDATQNIFLELILDDSSFDFKRAILSVSCTPDENGSGRMQAIDFIIERGLISQIVGEIEQFSQILSPSDSDNYSGFILDKYMIKYILHTIINDCPEIKIPYKKVVLMDESPTTLDIGLGLTIFGFGVDLGISPEFGKYNSFTLEEGVFIPVDRENNIAKFVKYSSYSDSLFGEEVGSLTKMIKDLLFVIVDLLFDSLNVMSKGISDITDTILDVGVDIGGEVVGGSELIIEAGTDLIPDPFSFSPYIKEFQKACILPCDIKEVEKEIVALPTDYLTIGGVGEFYHLLPIKYNLSKPFQIALKPDKEEKRVTVVSIAPLDDPFIVGGFYSLQPVDKILSKPAILNLTYTDKAIKGRDPEKFLVYHFNKEINAWEVIPSKHDRSEQKLIAQITKLGEYCIGYDDTSPEFSLLDYPSGEIILTAFPRLRIKCKDAGSGINPYSLIAKIDGEAVNLDFNLKLGIAQLNYDFPLDAGEHQIIISGQDMSENSTTQKFILKIQLPPSPLKLEDPIVGDYAIELKFSPSQKGTFPLKQLILRRAEPYKGKIFHALAILEPGTIYFKDESIEPKTNYAYQIFAEDTQGNRSIYSNIVYAETKSLVLSPPEEEDILLKSFYSNGEMVNGWYWLRDPSLQNYAQWIFENIPPGENDLTLEITALASDSPNGRKGLPAEFLLIYEVPGRSVFVTQKVALTNVSSSNDPVGYTCQGQVTIPRSVLHGASVLFLRAERISPDANYVAFNKESIKIITTTTHPPSQGIQLPDTNNQDEAFLIQPGIYNGSLGGQISGDQIDRNDWYSINIQKGQIINLQLTMLSDISFDLYLRRPGSTSSVRLVTTQDNPKTLQYVANVSGFWYIKITCSSGESEYQLSVDIQNQNDAASNRDAGETPEEAIAIYPGTFMGYLKKADNDDWYSINIQKGQIIILQLFMPPNANFKLYLYRPGSTSSVRLVTTTQDNSKTLQYEAKVSGIYRIKIHRSSGEGNYQLIVNTL
jgi:PKD repeat protein